MLLEKEVIVVMISYKAQKNCKKLDLFLEENSQTKQEELK